MNRRDVRLTESHLNLFHTQVLHVFTFTLIMGGKRTTSCIELAF